jgi:hypothetical protein
MTQTKLDLRLKRFNYSKKFRVPKIMQKHLGGKDLTNAKVYTDNEIAYYFLANSYDQLLLEIEYRHLLLNLRDCYKITKKVKSAFAKLSIKAQIPAGIDLDAYQRLEFEKRIAGNLLRAIKAEKKSFFVNYKDLVPQHLIGKATAFSVPKQLKPSNTEELKQWQTLLEFLQNHDVHTLSLCCSINSVHIRDHTYLGDIQNKIKSIVHDSGFLYISTTLCWRNPYLVCARTNLVEALATGNNHYLIY